MAKIRLPNAGDAYLYWKPYLDKWSVDLSEEEFFNYWFKAEKEAPEMIAIARELKNKGIKIFILSNNFIERAAYYRHNFQFIQEISEKIYYSWETGFIKPNIEAYKKILLDNNLAPEDCVYFDDAKENIEAAANLGIKSYLFEDAEGARKILKAGM